MTSAIPQAAIFAARKAYWDTSIALDEDAFRRVLTAAYPHLLEALAQDAEDQHYGTWETGRDVADSIRSHKATGEGERT